ncbi:MAG: hypothetical protein EXQ69_03270 [Acidimicrobiia bacterium]|nr:hypothetical protein [Acidimicrobiia bacterium]
MVGGKCPFCLWPIAEGELAVTCVHCNVKYHDECYAANGACTTFGCPGWAQRPLGGASLEETPVAALAVPTGRIEILFDDERQPDPEPSAASPSASEVFCGQCGTPTATEDDFCTGCGHPNGVPR